MRSVTQQAVQQSPDAVLIVVSNPLDAMCHVAFASADLPRERVIAWTSSGLSGHHRGSHRRSARTLERNGVADMASTTASNLALLEAAAGVPITQILEPAR